MEDKCLCEQNEILIFSCAGSSNVGQTANQAAIRLTQDGLGRYFCLAGIGGHVSGMIESTKAGKMIIAIDGCPVACAKRTLDHAGFNIDEYVQVTELGIEKNHDFNLNLSDIEKVTHDLASRISKRKGILISSWETHGRKELPFSSCQRPGHRSWAGQGIGYKDDDQLRRPYDLALFVNALVKVARKLPKLEEIKEWIK